ncbi:MAG: hypothetical protein O3A29_17365 [Planctomycetota bacterium]|nr:hypothetical protein [Planctomycetota bacterium]
MSRPLSSRALLRILLLTASVLGSAGGIGVMGMRVPGREFIQSGPRLPIPFWFSTLLLFVTSVLLQLSLDDVKRERQRQFRRRLWSALMTATSFLGIQGYGLWGIVQRHRPDETPTGSEPFVIVFAALHWAHVIVAVLVLVYVTVQAEENRYDHEYYWGPIVCTFFWHALGWIWLCILAACVIAL